MISSRLVQHWRSFRALAWKRMFRYSRPYLGRLTVAGILLFISSLFTLALPWVTGELVNTITKPDPRFSLNVATGLMLGLLAAQVICGLCGSYVIAWTDESILARLRQDAFNHLQELPLSFFTNRRRGELASRISNDIESIGSVTTQNLIQVFLTGVRLCGSFVMMLYLSPRLSLYCLLAAPLYFIIALPFGSKTYSLAVQTQDLLAEITSRVSETVSNIRVIKSFTREQQERDRFRKAVEAAFRTAMRFEWLMAMYRPMVAAVAFLTTLIVLWYGGRRALAGEMEPGDLVAFLLYTYALAGACNALAGYYHGLLRAFGSLKRTFEVLEAETESSYNGSREAEQIDGRICFEAVRFRYREELPLVLDDLDLAIEAGETIGLIGPSGAGKSTLLNLIPRFYPLTQGRILLDDQDLADLTVQSVRRRIGIVPQEVQLFYGSVRANLLFGCPEADMDELQRAAKEARAHDFIMDLPRGYDSEIGDAGMRLSAGQRQRLAIARVILKNPSVLLLDEPTNALDLESEVFVQEALRRLMEGRTTIIAGHHFTSFQNIDKIAVLQDGKLTEFGTPAELLAANGYYARIQQRLHAVQE